MSLTKRTVSSVARMMEKITPVKIISDELSCYSTIQRSMISAINASLRLGDYKHTEMFNELRKWASDNFDAKLREKKLSDVTSD